MAADSIVTQTNAKITGYFSGVSGGGILRVLGWIFFIIIIVAACWYGYTVYRNKKIFNKKITVFDIVGINFVPAMRDVAKVVKIGSGGFEILYLKKLKIYRIAYGGKVGKDTYYFFILPDGYWYNGMLSAHMNTIDKNGGLIPVVTTNPTMRSQYTSLEKQIDALHSNKQSVWDKYGSWILSIGFVVISGVMLWLSYKEYAASMASLSGLVDKIGLLVDKVASLQGGGTPTGLVKVG
jgi:hypothetical protein